MAGPEQRITLEVRACDFDYGGRPALRQVDLDARPGEIVGLIGPNGSGKSTLIKLVSGLLAPRAGTIRVGGASPREMPPRTLARLLAVVPQEPLFGGFAYTALEIVLMGRHPHLAGLVFESRHDRTLAEAALARCGVGQLAHRSIHALSAGERQRVVFARALAQEPRALLLDEPASFLDLRHQIELYALVRELAHERGVAVLTVLHDLNLAAEFCDRIYLLSEGRAIAGGPPLTVLTSALLTPVFGVAVHVERHSATGKLLVIPLAEKRGQQPNHAKPSHARKLPDPAKR